MNILNECGVFMNRHYKVISSVLMLILITALIIIPETRNRIHNEFLNNQMYSGIYDVITNKAPKVIVKEVEKPYTPSGEEIVIAKYIRSQNNKMSSEISQLISRFVVEASQKHKIPTELIVGVIEKESIFNPSAATAIPSKPGDFARGLMQIYQAEDITIDKGRAYDLVYNLDMGCSILNKKLELSNGDLEKALSNYSGRADGYAEAVLQNVGRLTLYRWMNPNSDDVAMGD